VKLLAGQRLKFPVTKSPSQPKPNCNRKHSHRPHWVWALSVGCQPQEPKDSYDFIPRITRPLLRVLPETKSKHAIRENIPHVYTHTDRLEQHSGGLSMLWRLYRILKPKLNAPQSKNPTEHSD